MLDRLLAGTVPNPDGDGMLSTPLKTIVIGRDLAAEASGLVRPLDLGARLAVVMDPGTQRALGERVADALCSERQIDRIVLQDRPHPDMDAVRNWWWRRRRQRAG